MVGLYALVCWLPFIALSIFRPVGHDARVYAPVVQVVPQGRVVDVPVGAQASIAVYTDRVHALSILRKIILRVHAWENYVF
jgi:hypothetical protein